MLLTSALVALGCSRDATLDQAELTSAIATDEATSRALKQADDLARAGHPIEAADLLKRAASPAAEQGVSAATALAPRTAWGRNKKDALVRLTADRKREIEGYETAIRVGSDEETLTALTKQIDIEQRAAALAQDIERGP